LTDSSFNIKPFPLLLRVFLLMLQAMAMAMAMAVFLILHAIQHWSMCRGALSFLMLIKGLDIDEKWRGVVTLLV
jgi:hypothetical protein